MTKTTVGDRRNRGSDMQDCDEEHDGVIKSVMNRMTIRVGLMLFACVSLVSVIMSSIAGGQISTHKAEDHVSLLPQPVIEQKLEATEARLEDKIDEVKEDLQGDIEQIQAGQVRMENKMDHMMELLMSHDRGSGQ